MKSSIIGMKKMNIQKSCIGGRSMSFLSNHLTIRHFRTVDAIEEECSIIRAANRLNLTQSAVTKILQEIENLTDVRLFERTNRGVVPTEAGRILAEDARRVLAHITHAEQHLADLRSGASGRVVIGTLLSASADLLPQAITRVRRDHPRTTFKVVVGTDDVLMPALRTGELDMVIGRLSENYNPGDVVQEVLVSDNAVVVVRHDHPLVAAEGLQLLDLLDWNWILPPKETNLRYQIDRSFREEGLSSPLPSVESVSPLINRGLLLQADYLSVLPAQVARNEVGVGQLAILPVRLRSTEGWLGITVLPHARLSPAAEHFLAALRETAKGMQRIPQSTIPSAHV